MQTLVVPIVGLLPTYLNTSADNASWVITATLLAAAVVMPIAGRIADMFGKRSVILASIALMVVGSVVSATFDSLIPVIVDAACRVWRWRHPRRHQPPARRAAPARSPARSRP